MTRVIDTIRGAVPRELGVGLASAGLAATAATHAAVLAGRLPHTAVSGGRVTDARRARQIAGGSLAALLPAVWLIARGAGLAGGPSRPEQVALGVLAVGGLASVSVQALGTSFERRFMVPTAAAQAAGFARLAVGDRR